MASFEHTEEWHKVESQLQLADIILVHGTGYIHRAIQERSGSYWNHTALVLQPPRPDLGIRGAFIVGAIDSGIEVHRLRKYSERSYRFDIGVKRLPGLTESVKQHILSFLLNKIDQPYDYTRLVGFLLENFLKSFLSKKMFKKLRRAVISSNPDSFVCSTFMQHAFFESVPRQMQTKTLVREHLRSLAELDEVTPADFARSPNYEWIFNPHD